MPSGMIKAEKGEEPDLGNEVYEMSMMQAVKSVFGKYANFRGRARRKEYWLFYLFNLLLYIVLSVLIGVLGGDAMMNDGEFGGAAVLMGLMGLYSLVCILPGLAVSCRRLHDSGRSGAYLLFVFVPVVGFIFLLIWLIQDGTPGENVYGPDPKGASAQQAYTPPAYEPQEYTPPVYKPQAYEQTEFREATRSVPSAAQKAWTPVLRADSGVFRGRSFPVDGRMSVGRSPGNTVVFPQDVTKISRQHCEFTVSSGRLFVRDLGSTNGTLINGSRRLTAWETYELKQGDRVSFGTLNDTFTVE